MRGGADVDADLGIGLGAVVRGEDLDCMVDSRDGQEGLVGVSYRFILEEERLDEHKAQHLP